MRVLIIKMSSLGDIIHTLPALTDAKRVNPALTFDWVVEENFAEIPAWHPAVSRVIPIALRRWRKNIFSKKTWQEWLTFRKTLRKEKYDLIIDAQGLLKSAMIARQAQGPVVGFDQSSAREGFAAWFYQKRYPVAKQQHAITRVRELVSHALGYPVPTGVPQYGLTKLQFKTDFSDERYLVFLHGTTWDTKHWPEEYWIALAYRANQDGFRVYLPWGSLPEHDRAKRIASATGATVLPRLDLLGIAKVLSEAHGVICVDTGLGHLAAALDVPTLALFGPTNPSLSGIIGQRQKTIAATFPCAPCMQRECKLLANNASAFTVKPPCFAALAPEQVWQEFTEIRLCTAQPIL